MALGGLHVRTGLRSSRYGSLPIYLLPRKASVFYYLTAYCTLLYINTATPALLTTTSNTSSSLAQLPTPGPLFEPASQPVP